MVQQQNNPIEQVLELLTEQGSDALAEALRILLNAAMLFERERFLNATPYERTAERRDYANGFKPKRLRTRVGLLDLSIPQVRNSDFYPQALERGTRSERALKLALAEMYVRAYPRAKSKPLLNSFAASRSRAHKSHGAWQSWTPNSSNGVSAHSARRLTSKWMRVTRRCEKVA